LYDTGRTYPYFLWRDGERPDPIPPIGDGANVEKSSVNLTRDDGTNLVGDTIEYTVVASNDGPIRSIWADAVMTDELPDKVTFVEDSVKINGEEAEKSAAQGGIQFSTDFQRWRFIERKQQILAARIAKTENALDVGRFFANYFIPHYFGAGGLLQDDEDDSPVFVVSAYNRIFLGNFFYIDYGFDFAFFNGNMGDMKNVEYNSFYPYILLGIGSKFEMEGGADIFLAVGGGCMIATYNFNDDTARKNSITPVFEIMAGYRYKSGELSYSFLAGRPVNHMVRLSFHIIPKF
jgi:uncharacterized repeat protein (TIGR01451 family)